jgi:hypothetical protein
VQFGADYVMSDRDYSAEFMRRIVAEAAAHYQLEPHEVPTVTESSYGHALLSEGVLIHRLDEYSDRLMWQRAWETSEYPDQEEQHPPALAALISDAAEAVETIDPDELERYAADTPDPYRPHLEDLGNIDTVRDLCDAAGVGTYDAVVPQPWYDEHRQEIEERGPVVWSYDERISGRQCRIFGAPLFADTLATLARIRRAENPDTPDPCATLPAMFTRYNNGRTVELRPTEIGTWEVWTWDHDQENPRMHHFNRREVADRFADDQMEQVRDHRPAFSARW